MSNKKCRFVRRYFSGSIFFLLAGTTSQAQINTVNEGALFISPATTVFFGGAFTNSATGVVTHGGQIFLQGDWTNDGSFSATGSVQMEGASSQTINGLASTTFYDLIIDKISNGVLLNQTVSVNNQLFLSNGNLDLNSKTISIQNPAVNAISFTNGFIISEQTDNSSVVSWTISNNIGQHIIPFGAIGGTVLSLTIDLTGGDIGTVTASTYTTLPSNIPFPVTPDAVTNLVNAAGTDNSANTVDRFWQIDKTGISGSATLTFTYADTEIPANGELYLAAQRYDNLTDKWQTALPSQVPDILNNRVTVPNTSAFGPFTLALVSEPLPIELLEFDAQINDKKQTDITWTTSSEINNDYFTVQKSKDGVHFENLQTVDGAGNSSVMIHYKTVDPDPYHGLTYYRLMQTDFNGLFSLSKIKVVSLRDAGENLLTVYPNPAREEIMVNGYWLSGEKVELKIFDSLGRIVYESQPQTSNLQLQTSSYSAGVYTIQVSAPSGNSSVRFVKE